MRLLRTMADEAADALIRESDLLLATNAADQAAAALSNACDAKAQLEPSLAQLDLGRSDELASAQAALEKISCPPAEGAGLDEAKQALDHLYSATVFLRAAR